MSHFTLGSDPEVILVNRFGKPISAEMLIGGSKSDPLETKHGHVQEDNVLVEFNTKPASTRDEFIINTQNMLSDIQEIITPLDLSVDIKSSGLFDRDQLQTYQAMTAGCDPDYNAWTGDRNNPPQLGDTLLRTCGGHLHIAFDKAKRSKTARSELVLAMDVVAGIPSVLMDDDTQRRTLYGQAGAYRPKVWDDGDDYDGVEYRTLSNFWVASKGLIGWAYDAVDTAVNNTEELLLIVNREGERIQHIINTSDKTDASKFVAEYGLEVGHA